MRDRQQIAEQRLLQHQRAERHPQRHHADRRRVRGGVHLAGGRPQHAGADGQQQHAKRQRSRVLEALVPVLMVFVGPLAAVYAGEQHDEIGQHVRQRMDGIGQQRLRAGQDAGDGLGRGQHQIDRDADQRAAARGALPQRGIARVVGGLDGTGLAHGLDCTAAACAVHQAGCRRRTPTAHAGKALRGLDGTGSRCGSRTCAIQSMKTRTRRGRLRRCA